MTPKSCTRTWAVVGAAGLLASSMGCSAASGGGSGSLAPSSGTGSGSVDASAGTEGAMSGESSGAVSASGSSSGSASGPADDAGPSLGPSSGASDEGGSGAVGGEGGVSPPDSGSGVDAGNTECSGGKMGVASDGQSSTQANGGYGDVQFNVSTMTQIVSLYTTLAVPAKPAPSGTLFLWPGLQPLPGGMNYNPIGNGVLQPVLTWGSTCAPTAPNDYSSWWISGQYVNTNAYDKGHTGCNGGNGMDVAVGDLLDIAMTLSGTVWTQVVTDRQSGKMVNYAIDMLGQAQDWGLFQIEVPDGLEPVADVVFTSTKLTFAAPDADACQPSTRGKNDYFSAPQSSSDGTSCCVSKIILRGQGVAATSPDTP